MARKETITKNEILNTAFQMARQEGIAQVSARTLAAKAGCSTQPIFRLYKNMEELGNELYEKAIVFFGEYYENFPKTHDTPFVDLGLAYIRFAQEEQQLFKLLFISENRRGKSLYDLLNGTKGTVVREIGNARAHGGSGTPEEKVAEAVNYGITKLNLATDLVKTVGKATADVQSEEGFGFSKRKIEGKILP